MLGSAAGLRLRSCRELYGVELLDVQERSLWGQRRAQGNRTGVRGVTPNRAGAQELSHQHLCKPSGLVKTPSASTNP